MVSRKLKHAATAVLASIALLGAVGSASADAITDTLPGNTNLRIKFTNYENVITDLDQELFGLVNVTQILSASGITEYWGTGDGSKQLVGYFEGLTSIADQAAGTGLSFTGGKVVLYLVNSGLFSPSTSPNTKDYADQLCGGACPAAWLTLDFVPGINDSLGVAANATLQAAYASTSVQAGNGYLDITGGTAASFFAKDTFTFANFAPADASLRSNFSLVGSQNCDSETSQGWAVCSDDPINLRTVPEPASIALTGLALLGLATICRRRRSV